MAMPVMVILIPRLWMPSDSPALDAFVSRASLLPTTEFVPVDDQVETAVRPKALDKMFLCHDGSITYGPHTHNGAFNYDGSRNYDSGIFLRHDGRIDYGGSHAHDKWLRDCPLYNSYHDAGNFAASLSLNDRVRKQPDYSGEISFDGHSVYSPLAVPATDKYAAKISPQLTDEATPTEKGRTTVKAAIADETDHCKYDGSICYGQRRIRVYDGDCRHDGFSVSGPFGGNTDQKRFDGKDRYGGLLKYASVSPVYLYRSLCDSSQLAVNVDIADTCDLPMSDALETRCAPILEEKFRMEEALASEASYCALDEIGRNYDGAITYGQKHVSIHAGSVSYDGSRVSGFTGGMSKFRQRLHDSALKYDGYPVYSLWPDSLYSYRGFADSCHSRLDTVVADSFGLADELALSVRRVAFQNGRINFDSSNSYCPKEIL